MNKHDELPVDHEIPLIAWLNKAIRAAMSILAILMVLVIFWGVADVVFVLYEKLLSPPLFILEASDILKLFGAFLMVLIGVEVYQNIVLYLKTNIIPLKLVISTALVAIARKVIVLDFNDIGPMYILSTAAVTLALGITYFLIDRQNKDS
ncbi:phosphate-starvation-inducible PsiE family protein [uncultured Cocleimonas sp.]|uniref:phosphate-starvation-inducible PsiE family protein n=1 Tax=uncultured Cocleimonas sp. TaxID=1051587 RepID=UPI00262DF9EE|nr:phosphate-starvation-inducible PsiE family protein [uncultured Cocleimonas sp.]